MKWFDFNYVKRKPMLFVGIVLVFGILFWFMLNRGSAQTSTVITNGKSDAQIAAETQLAMAGMSAQIQNNQVAAQLAAIGQQGDIAIALAKLDQVNKTNELQVQREIAAAGIAAQLHAMDIAYQQSVNNNAFQLDYATLAFDASIASQRISAQAMTTSMLASMVPSLKKGKQVRAFDNLLLLLSSGNTGQTLTNTGLDGAQFPPQSSGGGLLGGIGKVIVGPIGGLLT